MAFGRQQVWTMEPDLGGLGTPCHVQSSACSLPTASPGTMYWSHGDRAQRLLLVISSKQLKAYYCPSPVAWPSVHGGPAAEHTSAPCSPLPGLAFALPTFGRAASGSGLGSGGLQRGRSRSFLPACQGSVTWVFTAGSSCHTCAGCLPTLGTQDSLVSGVWRCWEWGQGAASRRGSGAELGLGGLSGKEVGLQ